jgi:hypothetical protein
VLGAPYGAILTRPESNPKRCASYFVSTARISSRTKCVQVSWPGCCECRQLSILTYFEPRVIFCSWFMGADALQGNGITLKILFFLRDKTLTPRDEPLHKVRKSRILLFVVVQLVGFGATFAITQTVGMEYRSIVEALS